jgi:hypothetical protein
LALDHLDLDSALGLSAAPGECQVGEDGPAEVSDHVGEVADEARERARRVYGGACGHWAEEGTAEGVEAEKKSKVGG